MSLMSEFRTFIARRRIARERRATELVVIGEKHMDRAAIEAMLKG